MQIKSLQDIWDNLGYVIQKHNDFKKVNEHTDRLIYNCAPSRMKDGSVMQTFIDVGYLFLSSAVPNDSQGFIWFECKGHLNYDDEHKVRLRLPERISDKLVGQHNINIAQIYNDETKEFLKKDSNIVWRLVKGQALFTTLEEAQDYIKKCEAGEVDIKDFFIKVEEVKDTKSDK